MDLYTYKWIFFSVTCFPFVVSSAVVKQGSVSKSLTVRHMEQNGRHQQQQQQKKQKRVTTRL